ncbi:GNAT family N-acetyltransferase [Acinetobacter sp. S40]|uniref:GNAT family N-acetyltransferase n=1 Tax=unclassified Acinetobacter TaxID=196816 RepID=UPI00190A8A80|nr:MULTISPECIES: GNAT family N-acetyltransferase [unclassified Acinetobacter]MBJ9985677.1 GNAT family N-acetyltransferase [Acinetobacter sp. S40]MBK0064077.1 GNAT family N-acetyltransferase [Acinetobacter sp. S55]MBK0067414.1 GNAT family N-acetyltransferase [Acinetobacter sp. S54]
MALMIELLQPADVSQATQFAIYTRQLLFPEVYQSTLPHDLTHFSATYLNDPHGACLVVKDKYKIIGMVAYRSYNHRFQLDLPLNSVEVVKLFIQPEYRRQGLASQLCHALFEHAQQQNIWHFYLHTHPFLPAAEYFWQKQGFQVIHREWLAHYDTIHMFKTENFQ